MAPEVLDGKYDSKVDTWSLGVLLYVFMSGYLPFQGDSRNDVFHKIQTGKYHFNHPEFNDCSPDVKDLIKNLLVVDPKVRLSAGDAMNHAWFKQTAEEGDVKITIQPGVLNRLQSFRGVSKLKKAAMNMLVKMAD
jgi:calcium-dependent protein kinase